jgi:hypothetical protein
VKIGVIAVVPFAVFATRSRRSIFAEAATATIIAFAGWWLVSPVTVAVQTALDLFDPMTFASLYVGRTGVLPFAPIYAASTAIAVVSGHLLLRFFRRPH